MINNKDIKKVGLITTLIYTMTLITSIILNQESDLKVSGSENSVF